MAENMNSNKGEDDNEKTQEESTVLQRPKHIHRKNQKTDPLRSKSAPAEEFNDIDESEDYIGSYNYFIYYNSIKPADPRLPKPTYKPKPNLDFIKEIKDKEEEEDDTQEKGNDNLNLNSLDNLETEFNQLNLGKNTNYSNNNQNQNLFDQNFMNNFPNNPNQNQNKKNNFNSGNDAPSPFDYYSQSMNIPNQQNDMWNEQNVGMGIYNPAIGPGMAGMAGMNMNPMNPLLGMNMGMAQFGNMPQYGNMMGMNPSLMNPNMRMNQGNGQYTRGKKNQKKGNNRNQNQENLDQMNIQSQMFNNMYNNQLNNNFVFPTQNPMLNMNLNYLNDPRFQMMQMNQGFQRNNLMQGDMNNFNFNLNNGNKMNKKNNKKGDNFIRKDANEYNNIEDIIENAVNLSKDHSGSRLVQKK